MKKSNESRKNAATPEEFYVSQIVLANLLGRLDAQIRKWEKAGIVIKTEKGYPVLENARRVVDHLCSGAQQKSATNAEKIAEQVRNLKLDAEAKERARKKDESEWLEASVWLDKIGEHIGGLRAKIKVLFLTDQPATLSGRTEIEIREANIKTYAQLCRWMQNAATKLRPPGSREIIIQDE